MTPKGLYVPKICKPACVGGMEGTGGIVLLSVRGVQIKLKGIVPGRPKGAMVTQREGPMPDMQGTEEVTRPPKGMNPVGTAACIYKGAAKNASTVKLAAILTKLCIFSLYTKEA